MPAAVVARSDAGPRRTQSERRTATQRLLLDATVASILEVGYARTTTTDVCARAGVSQGALFKHYPTKQQLVAAAAAHLYDELITGYVASLDVAPETVTISRAIEVLGEIFRRPELAVAYELQVAARTDPELRRSLAPIVDRHAGNLRRQAAELFPDLAGHPRFDVLFDLVLESLQGLAVSRMVGPYQEHESGVIALLVDLCSTTLEGPAEHASITTRRKR
ncbi:MAG TPA: TetR/AcrR family transcriptional regulator [Acidimicrobiales bacterium]|nr:TetR/AcrR family transcriptional regulator [Acidimicrobiales bacterium]